MISSDVVILFHDDKKVFGFAGKFFAGPIISVVLLPENQFFRSYL